MQRVKNDKFEKSGATKFVMEVYGNILGERAVI